MQKNKKHTSKPPRAPSAACRIKYTHIRHIREERNNLNKLKRNNVNKLKHHVQLAASILTALTDEKKIEKNKKN